VLGLLVGATMLFYSCFVSSDLCNDYEFLRIFLSSFDFSISNAFGIWSLNLLQFAFDAFG
jgi:hypothetical protein